MKNQLLPHRLLKFTMLYYWITMKWQSRWVLLSKNDMLNASNFPLYSIVGIKNIFFCMHILTSLITFFLIGSQVQYPGLEQRMKIDIITMTILSKLVAWVCQNSDILYFTVKSFLFTQRAKIRPYLLLALYACTFHKMSRRSLNAVVHWFQVPTFN